MYKSESTLFLFFKCILQLPQGQIMHIQLNQKPLIELQTPDRVVNHRYLNSTTGPQLDHRPSARPPYLSSTMVEMRSITTTTFTEFIRPSSYIEPKYQYMQTNHLIESSNQFVRQPKIKERKKNRDMEYGTQKQRNRRVDFEMGMFVI